jgi:hypothetical protein
MIAKHQHSVIPWLQAAFMACPGIMQDRQVVAALLQTSKQLRQAVVHVLAGQLTVELQAQTLQQAQSLVLWLHANACTVRSLQLQLPSSSSATGAGRLAAVVAALEAPLQRAAAAGSLQLQSFTLQGSITGHTILQQLPVLHLMQLCVDVNASSIASIQAVAALSSLRCLQLQCTAAASDDVLYPLAAGLQQLTQLKIGPVTPAQLQHLPPKLQQLHVTVRLGHDPQQLQKLACWLQQHFSIVTSLHLLEGNISSSCNPNKDESQPLQHWQQHSKQHHQQQQQKQSQLKQQQLNQ